MDKTDLQQIDQLLDQRLKRTEDKFDQKLDQRLKKTEDKIIIQVGEFIEQNVVTTIEENRKAITQLPTKSYLDDKLADLTSDVLGRLRKEDEKVNRLIDFLRSKNIIDKSEVQELGELKVFPKLM